uniref:Uncharacterized protein n=1 Tax=Oryza punctata TaxID=4537 RepID=A0A0E0L0D1_ORYPU
MTACGDLHVKLANIGSDDPSSSFVFEVVGVDIDGSPLAARRRGATRTVNGCYLFDGSVGVN